MGEGLEGNVEADGGCVEGNNSVATKRIHLLWTSRSWGWKRCDASITNKQLSRWLHSVWHAVFHQHGLLDALTSASAASAASAASRGATGPTCRPPACPENKNWILIILAS